MAFRKTWTNEQLTELYQIGKGSGFAAMPEDKVEQLANKWGKTDKAVRMKYYRMGREYKEKRKGMPLEYKHLPKSVIEENQALKLSERLNEITEGFLELGQELEAVQTEIRELEKWAEYTANFTNNLRR